MTAGGPLIRTLSDHTGAINVAVLTPDGSKLISGSDDRTLKVWDVDASKKRGALLHTLEGYSDWVRALVLTPDGKRAISGSDDHTLEIWGVETGQLLATFTADWPITTLIVSPSGETIVAGDQGAGAYVAAD